MKKLIVTADDYGMSRGVNDAIDAGVSCGLITSTNVMTNMEYYREAEKLRSTDVSVGLHWTISTGSPVLNPEEIKSLVNSEGNFYSYPEFRKRYRKGLISNQDIVKELKAQYNRFVEVCGKPDYWNTHENTHVDFGVFKLFVDTANELGIYKMRSHRRVYIPASNGVSTKSLTWRLIEPVKRMILKSWMQYAARKKMASPYGITVPLRKTDLKDPEYCFSNLHFDANIVAEYVIHPATALDSKFFGNIGDDRIYEYKQFTSQEQKEILKKNHFELIGFSGL